MYVFNTCLPIENNYDDDLDNVQKFSSATEPKICSHISLYIYSKIRFLQSLLYAIYHLFFYILAWVKNSMR